MKKVKYSRVVYTGKVDHISKQYAYIVVPESHDDILVSDKNLKGAWHGDLVKVVLLPLRKGKRKEGRVIEVVERAKNKIIGQIYPHGRYHLLKPDHKRMHHPILLPKQEEHLSQKAIVEVTKWSTEKTFAEGKVSKTLGKAGSHRAETEAITLQFDFETSFSTSVEKQAKSFADTLSKKEIEGRRDFRPITTLTIDPDDAQDFDDALSLQKLPNGRLQVGIHIADVSHYVQPNSPIDQEALKRGTSVYLVGQVVPMLPERISNNLCSLVPHQDRPAFSVVVEMDSKGHIYDAWMGETIIHSDQRLTYAQAKKIIEEEPKNPFHTPLNTLHTIATELRAQRIKKGAIPFNSTDFNIHLDEAGEPIHITLKKSSFAHHLIEEFMLLANRLVAEKVFNIKTEGKKSLPFLYRVHDRPDPEKIGQLTNLASQLGYSFKPEKNQLAPAYHKLLTAIEGTPHQHILQQFAIRTMAQARYTTEPQPHFGLAFQHYTHFTSPIRRYPDLIVHRLLKKYLQGDRSTENPYEEIAAHASQRERLAVEAERASIQYKQVSFMQKMEGKKMKGLITHIAQWGIFVEIIENKCEGMVRLTDLKDDYYLFEEEKFRLRGRKTGKIYRLGDTVEVQVKMCDLEKRTIDLIFP